MKRRVRKSTTKKQMRSPASLHQRSNPFVSLTLPARRDKPRITINVGTKYLRSRKFRSHTLYRPDSKTILSKRRSPPLVPPGRTVQRNPVLISAIRTPGKRNICAKRDIRKSVLFSKKLVGYSGSSPGRHRTYKRTVDSTASCK